MSKKKSHYGKAGLVFEELEPKLLLSADPLAVAADADLTAVQELVLDNNEAPSEIVQTPVEQSDAAVRNELVIIDSRAPNYQQLHNDLLKAQQQGRNIHIVVLDAHRDGIDQINEALANYNALDALHIVSHGDDGQLQIGATQLNKTTLREHSADIAQWRDRFSDNGDLLLYGCELAETAEGKKLINALSYLTATDVAASVDLTGHQLMGGDWELEYEAGDIETSVAFSDDIQQQWQGTLEGAAPGGADTEAIADEAQQQQEQQQAQIELEQQQVTLKDKKQSELEQEEEEQQAAVTEEQRQELVFVDESVGNYLSFIDDLEKNSDQSTTFEIILLDGERSGIDQINETLSAYDNVDALHLVTHGSDATVKLGSTWLNNNNLDQYSGSLSAWSQSLDADADILIYGCNLAESSQGEHFVAELAQLTETDIAVSTDITGHALFGGDWDLEYLVGAVETDVAFSEELQQGWSESLATFVVSNTAASGAGSFHQAILDANANTGVTDTITFNIAGAGPHVISLTGPLPTITDSIIIDGTSEPDFSYAGDGSPRPVVVIDGTGAGAVDGIVLGAGSDGSTIRGLVVQNFQNNGILVLSDNNTIAASILGLQVDGVTVAGNNWPAATTHLGNIRIESANNTIGGLTPADRNIISGGGYAGLVLIGGGSTGNQVLGNFIGTDITGTLDRGNTQEGIEIDNANGNTIGGTVAGARNIISGNDSDGIEIDNGDNNIIQGNYIGTDVTGTVALGNVRDGIDLNDDAVAGSGSTGNLIGGTDPNAGNLISGNGLNGVEVRDPQTSSNTILGNRIYNNGDLGIELATLTPADVGVSGNDAGDPDTGSNSQQNFPVLTAADTNTVDTIVIDGTLNSTANSYFRIEFFASSAADGSGNGEGENYLGYVNVATDGSGNASYSASLSATVVNGAVISATATKSDATYTSFTDTSEFAANINAVANYSAGATDDPQAYSTYLTSLSPTGYWRMGEGAGTTAVDSTGSNDGTYNGATLGQSGAIAADGDTALSFDGVDDYMELTHDPAYLLDDGTVQFWFNTADVTQRADLFSKDAMGNVTGGHLSIYLDGTGNIETRLQSLTSDYFVNSTLPLTNNQWHHVAMTFGAGGMQLYVDGQLQDSDAYTGGLGTTSGGAGNFEPIAIGASTQVSGSGLVTPLQDYFSGSMDEVALFGTALTADQVQNLYAGGLQNYTVAEDNTLNVTATEGVLINDYDQEGDSLTAVLVTGPSNAAAFTLYNDGSFDYTPTADFNGTDTFTYMAHDGTSNSNVATVTITVTPENDAPVDLQVTGTTQGGASINEDGGNDVYFVADDGAGLLGGLTTVTIESSFSVTTPGADLTPLLSYADGANDEELALFLKSDGRIWFATHSNGSPLQSTTGTYTQLFDGEVHHVGVSWDSATGAVVFYVDGQQVESFSGYQTGQTITGGGELVFGQDQDSELGGFRTIDVFSGKMYDVRIFDDIRTPAEIAASFDQTLPNTEPGMIANWMFNDLTTGGIVTDTVSGNDLTEQHVVGAGFSSSTPELTLVIREDANNGTVIGSVTAIDPDVGDTFNYTLFDDAGGRFDINAGDGQITLIDASQINYESASSHNITVRVTDSGALTYDEVFTINVLNVNEAPVNTVPGTQTVLEDTQTAIAGISIADVDAGANAITTQLSVSDGVLDVTLAGTAGISAGANGSNTLTISGTVADINATLASLQYTGNLNVNGTAADTLSVVTDDQGNSGDGGALSDSDNIQIDITAVNDVPVATTNTVNTTEDNSYNFSAGDFTFSDIEGDSLVAARITNLNLNGGTLTYGGGTAVIDGNTLTAAQLDTLVYTPAANANGLPLATFDFTVNDAGAGVVTAQMNIDVTASNDLPQARDDRIGLVFDGVDDYVTIGDYAGLVVSTNMTMEAWIRPTGLGAGSKIIVNKEGEYEMAINATTGEVMWAFDNVDPDWNWHYTGYFVQPNEWTHLAVSYNNGVVNTYANGVLVDTYNGSGAIGDNYPALNQLQIGGRENAVTQRFDGQIDEVRLWNSTRTQLDIQTNMGSLLSGAEPGLIGNWRFDEGSGFTVEDQSVFGHHGTLADGVTAGEMPTWQGYVVNEEGTLNVSAVNGVLANDFDIDGDPLTAILVTGPANAASFTLNPDGSFDYTPTANFTGVDTFTYRANDGSGDSNIATVSIRVAPVNDVPVATANTVSTTEDNAYTFSAADFTFTDVEGDALVSATITNLNLGAGTLTHSGGTAVNNNDTLTAAELDTLIYTPVANTSGTPLATFDFTVNDAGTGVAAALMSIDVTAVNDLPVATANTVATIEDVAYTFSAADFTFTDVEGDALVSATITNLSLAGGTLTHSSGTPVNNNDTLTAAQLDTLVYTPPAATTGAPLATFDFTVNDTGAGVAVAQMSINVAVANNVPVATANTVVTTEDNAYTFSAADFTYTDIEGDALVSATINNLSLTGGTLTHSGGTAVNNGDTLMAAQLDTLIYTPAADSNGTPLATFDFTVNDAGMGVVAAQMSINVTAQPDAAVIGGVDTGVVTEDDDPDTNNLLEVSGSLTIIDPDAGEATFNPGAFGGTYGVITLNAAGDWDYAAINSQPAIQGLTTGDTLTDTITISSVDGTTHDIIITIMGTNDAPVAGNDVASVNEGGSAIINVAATDSDVDNALDLTSISITSLPANGNVVVNGDGTVTYSHNGGETLTDSFSYTISDISGAVSNTATVTLSVNPVNDAPTTSGIADVSVNEDAASTGIDLNAAFDDVDNLDSELTYAIVGNTNIGLFSVAGIDNSTGQLTLDYATDMNGLAQISVRATDPSGSFVDTLFNVTVNAVNDNPVLQTNTGMATTDSTPATISSAELNATDVDHPDTELLYTVTTLPANGELRLNGAVMALNGTFTQADLDNNLLIYVPNGAVTADQFGFTVSDSAGGAVTNNSFNILVQFEQNEDEGIGSEPPPNDDGEEEEITEEETAEAESGGLTEGAGGYGGGFVPFGSSSPPPAPAPVLSIEPAPAPEQEQAPPVEEKEQVAAEVEQQQVTTFTAVQVKSIDALWSAIDKMKQEMAEAEDGITTPVEFQAAAAKSTGVVLTAGVVAWILRSGALLSSLMSTIPLWKGYDPLPILAYKDDDEKEKKEDMDEHKIPTSLEELRKLKKLMLQKQKAEKQVDVDSMFGGSTRRE